VPHGVTAVSGLCLVVVAKARDAELVKLVRAWHSTTEGVLFDRQQRRAFQSPKLIRAKTLRLSAISF
jgi:hypothetical protein